MASIPDPSSTKASAAKRRRRHAALAWFAAALFLAGGVLVVHRIRPGSSRGGFGSPHPVVMQRDQGLSDCSGNAEAWSGFEYDGVPWQPMGSFPPSWWSTGPWPGVLTITGRVPAGHPTAGVVVATGLFDYRGTQVPVFGGTGTRVTPLC